MRQSMEVARHTPTGGSQRVAETRQSRPARAHADICDLTKSNTPSLADRRAAGCYRPAINMPASQHGVADPGGNHSRRLPHTPAGDDFRCIYPDVGTDGRGSD